MQFEHELVSALIEKQSMVTVLEISTIEDFDQSKPAWNELLSGSESNNIFLTWDWLFTWWNVFGDDKELKILLVKNDGMLIGIAPLYISRNGNDKSFIKFLGSTYVASDHLDFISQKGSEDTVVSAIFDYLNLHSGEWKAINLIDMNAQSKSIDLIQSCCGRTLYITTKKSGACPYLSLPQNYNLYLDSLTSNMRYNIRRKRRRFEDEYAGSFIVIKEKSELSKAFEELIRLHVSRMRIKKMNSPFHHTRFARFHRNLLNSVFDKGWVRLCFLKIENELIACLYIFKYGEKYFYYQSGFDPKWEKISPGFVLFSYCIENAILEGASEFDFLRGQETYKLNWTNNKRTSQQINLYKKDLKSRVSYFSDKLKTAGKAKIKEIINK